MTIVRSHSAFDDKCLLFGAFFNGSFKTSQRLVREKEATSKKVVEIVSPNVKAESEACDLPALSMSSQKGLKAG